MDNTINLHLFNLKVKFSEKIKEDIRLALNKFKHKVNVIQIISISDNNIEIKTNKGVGRYFTRIISSYLSRNCSLDHLYGIEGNKRRLFASK